MTKKEISNTFDLPISTLNDWDKEESRKNKLFQFLQNMKLEDTQKNLKKKNTHRIFHILNRNIVKDKKFTYDEVRNAFIQTNYDEATQREKIVYSKFFKECVVSDLEDLEKVFHVSKRDIKTIYKQIPERMFKGVSEVWDKRFRLQGVVADIPVKANNIPLALQKVLERRTANV
ncbi:MAG: hypothetical protein U9N33_12280 [Campylobacterota bacterium]|nr:hypothetical protein [Campylobacterota bacterium]